MEIESTDQLIGYLDAGRTLRGARLQDIDLSGSAGRRLLDAVSDAHGMVVLGGTVPGAVAAALVERGALLFPADPALPVDPYRARLYSAHELYDGLAAAGYPTTPDARAYAWSRESASAQDAYATAMRALHDDAVRDALHEALAGHRTVGIMGGHALGRDTAAYRDVARLAKRLADGGFVVLTGGGPGAMEAANLGAATRNDHLDEALDFLASGPATFRPDIDAWTRVGFEARTMVGADRALGLRTVGIPTWFYGHEPPNVFGDAIAKYFSNAVREDDLLAGAREAVIVLEGAAGTVQEIFQAVTPMYYANPGASVPELVLVGRGQWTRTLPVWDALRALAAGREMEQHLHLVDTIAEAAAVLGIG